MDFFSLQNQSAEFKKISNLVCCGTLIYIKD